MENLLSSTTAALTSTTLIACGGGGDDTGLRDTTNQTIPSTPAVFTSPGTDGHSFVGIIKDV